MNEGLFTPTQKVVGNSLCDWDDAPVPEILVMCPETNGKFGRYKLVFEHLFIFPEATVFPDHHGLFRAAHIKEFGMFLDGGET